MDYRPIHKLRDLYPNPSNAIFTTLVNNNVFNKIFNRISLNSQNASAVDMDYLLNRSGDKTVSSFVEYLLDSYVFYNDGYVKVPDGRRVVFSEFIKDFNDRLIADLLSIKFYNKWDRLSGLLVLDYDILRPYIMDVSDDIVENVNNSGTDTLTDTSEENSNNTIFIKENKNHKIYGFNSDSGNDADSDENLTDRIDNIDSTKSDNSSHNFENTGNSNSERTILRKGNIGNKSFSELIVQEREQLQYQFLDVVYNDLDSVLTRSKWRW